MADMEELEYAVRELGDLVGKQNKYLGEICEKFDELLSVKVENDDTIIDQNSSIKAVLNDVKVELRNILHAIEAQS